MICRSCLRAASKASPSITSQRFLTTSSRLANATPISTNVATQTSPRQGDSTSSHNPPAATSTSAAQPFSEKLTPAASGSWKGQATEAAKKKVVPLVKSSIPAGTPLKGLNFEKNKQDPVALSDDEYPEWLWTILSRQEKSSEGAGMGDLFSKSKKQRRLAAKRLRKEQAMNPGMLEPKVPLYEQTVDLPAGDGSLEGAVRAQDARGELTKAMRDKRRADIKEKNFLKAMG
ncbi:mitochondrial ribosomal protein L37-domain-containing protein [Phaeosphaeria sp. MPI-PUGE-AT-0046c]|nr:mitochondrial ribosomal protein L37-domain-containing protein [Phaeosphaeria sp. MPI-PUGE-AT-0046c]